MSDSDKWGQMREVAEMLFNKKTLKKSFFVRRRNLGPVGVPLSTNPRFTTSTTSYQLIRSGGIR